MENFILIIQQWKERMYSVYIRFSGTLPYKIIKTICISYWLLLNYCFDKTIILLKMCGKLFVNALLFTIKVVISSLGFLFVLFALFMTMIKPIFDFIYTSLFYILLFFSLFAYIGIQPDIAPLLFGLSIVFLVLSLLNALIVEGINMLPTFFFSLAAYVSYIK